MIIGLDVRILSLTASRTGVPNYVYHLANHLSAIRNVQAVLFTDRPDLNSFRVVPPCVRFVPWQQSVLPFAAMKAKVDLFHGPGFSLPVWGKFKKVVTIHDLGFAKHPEWTDDTVSRYLKSIVPLSIRAADSIIVPTEEIQADLLEVYPELARSKNIAVIPMGSLFAASPPRSEPMSTLNRQRPYILHVGTLEPRKNLGTLIKAFDIATQTQNIPHNLVLIGSKGWKTERLEGTIMGSRVKDRIIIKGFVEEDELIHWYQRASLYVQPSHYEGFGMATLDAYCAGLPILSTKTGWVASMSDPAIRFIEEAGNVDEVASGLAYMLEHAEFPLNRNRERWSWGEAMHQHCCLYETTVGM